MIELAATGRLLDELQDVLSKHPGIEQILVSRSTLHHALTGFLDGNVDVAELVEWATRLEQHNDEIAYEPGFEQFIATFVSFVSRRRRSTNLSAEVCVVK